ncbi:MAG: hypothetical protein PUB29_07120 [Bacteroidales bacterium]|nr:hypothetical protein [Bacteroidales bacterium]
MYGEGALHAFEYRMHDTRIGRFWSVDPLAGKFPWNSVYAFAENSPIGFLELEGLEKVKFGTDVVDFTGKTEAQVHDLLRQYRKYHHGNISTREIMSSANDNEYWKVNDITDVYKRSIGTRIVKHTGTQVSNEIRRTCCQWVTRADGRIDGGYDGANIGTITTKDLVVGLGFVGAITGIGEIAAAGEFTVGVVVGLVNALDDAFGIFTKGAGSLSQDLTPEQAKVVTNSVKTILSAISTASSVNNLKKPETDKAIGVLNAILSGIGTTSNAKNTVEDARKKD